MRHFASLRRRNEFARLRSRGRRTATPNLTLFREPGRASQPLPVVGISVSSAVGNAVVRNRVRRRVAAALHELLKGTPPLRVLVIARPAAAGARFAQLHAELRRALS